MMKQIRKGAYAFLIAGALAFCLYAGITSALHYLDPQFSHHTAD